MTHISVIICVDVDPDGANVRNDKINKKYKPSWKGLEEEVPRVIDYLDSIKDSDGNTTRFSWFIRCDEQLNEINGDYGWVLDNFNDIFKRLRERGDELAWHPHFWRWMEEKGSWNQEIKDIKWMLNCLENSYNSFIKWNKEVPSVRMGWAYHNNYTMIKLNDLGVQADLSAVPRISSKGREIMGAFSDCYDWSISPEIPYFPSREDYRITGERKLKLLEIPMTVSRDPLMNAFFSMAIDNKFKSAPNEHHLTPIKDPKKFLSIIRRQIKIIKRNKKKKHIGMYFHPTDLFLKDAHKILKMNLESIVNVMKKEKVTFSFQTAKEAKSKILSEIQI